MASASTVDGASATAAEDRLGGHASDATSTCIRQRRDETPDKRSVKSRPAAQFYLSAFISARGRN